MYYITNTGHKADESGNESRDETGLASKPPYYSVMDHERGGRIMSTGRNSTRLAEIAESMEGYFIQDGDDKITLTAENVLEEIHFYGFEVFGHDEIIIDKE